MAHVTSVPQVGASGLGGNPVFDSRNSARIDAVAYGDSVTEGFFASDADHRWTNILIDGIKVGYPTTAAGGDGYFPGWYSGVPSVFPDPTLVGTANEGGFGFGRRSIGLPASGDSVTWTGVSGTTLRVWYPLIVGAGSHVIAIDPPLSATGGFLPSLSSGQYCSSTTIPAVNSVATANSVIRVEAHVEATDWTMASGIMSLGGWQDSIRVELGGTGSGFANRWRVTIKDPTARTATRSADTGYTDGVGRWVRFDIDCAADTVSFYDSTDPATTARGSITWNTVQAGAALSGATNPTSISVSTAIIGNFSTVTPVQPWIGKIRRHAGLIDGAVQWDVNLTAQPANAYFFMDSRSTPNRFTVTGNTLSQTGNGGTWVTGFTGTSTGVDTYVDIALTAGTHTVSATYHADGVGLYYNPGISGIQVLDGDETKGIQLINGGHGGYKASDFAAAGLDARITAQIAATSSPLVFVEFGYNDRVVQTPTEYHDNMVLLLAGILAGNAAARIVIIAGWTPDGATDWQDYVDVMHALAAVYPPASVIDFSNDPNWPQPGTDEGDASGYYDSGTVHLTDTGSAAVAGYIHRALFLAGAVTSTPEVA
jgi:hypothetical protein